MKIFYNTKRYKKITLNELRNLVKQVIKEENDSQMSLFKKREYSNAIHLVNDLYSDDLLGQEMKYGSPGYPMIFIPRSIKKISKTEFEFIGDIPTATIGTEGHVFIIDEKHLEELETEGETFWIGKDGSHLMFGY